mgnify:CR=1 FL=1
MRLLLVLFTLSLFPGCTVTSISSSFGDSRNESLARKKINDAHPGLSKSHINVTSFDGIVLITGQVPSEDLVRLATAEVEPLRNVRKVHNELAVAGVTSMLSRTNDSWLTAKVKSALIASEKSDASRIKVVTENGVVYLMGLLTRAESDSAVEITRGIRGVEKTVKLFEYMN